MDFRVIMAMFFEITLFLTHPVHIYISTHLDNLHRSRSVDHGPDEHQGVGAGAAGPHQAGQRPPAPRPHQDPQEEERQIPQEVHRCVRSLSELLSEACLKTIRHVYNDFI